MAPTSGSIAVAGTLNLVATAQFEGGPSSVTSTTTWSSSVPAKATVSSAGVVTGVSSGTTVITGIYGGKTVTVPITVT